MSIDAKWKVGDIIEVPVGGIRMVKRGMKTDEIDDVDDDVGVDVDDDNDDDAREIRGEDDDDDAIGGDEIDYADIDDDEEPREKEEEDEDEEEIQPIKKGGKTETQIDFQRKKLPIYEDSAARDLAKRMDL